MSPLFSSSCSSSKLSSFRSFRRLDKLVIPNYLGPNDLGACIMVNDRIQQLQHLQALSSSSQPPTNDGLYDKEGKQVPSSTTAAKLSPISPCRSRRFAALSNSPFSNAITTTTSNRVTATRNNSTGSNDSSSFATTGTNNDKNEENVTVTFTSSAPDGTGATTNTVGSSTAPKASSSRRRKRHRFDGNVDEIPSFHDFQQQQQVRSLYRKFLRLIYGIGDGSDEPNAGGGSRKELLDQLRRQFRQRYNSSASSESESVSSPTISTTSSNWDVKRALSEGSKRYKEVSAMLGNVISSNRDRRRKQQNDDDNNNKNGNGRDSSLSAKKNQATVWPWDQQIHDESNSSVPRRPSPFPKKTGL